eukprot:CAMPEP_0115353762 /NCGR_PEP_ID=MMETSP0270-20121206/98214_1 /TAXON_ID=71861 /ORGANISM="Scrippsiella trochoidea, Strain CCMP3099" /LENGTH=34 /DNA_ID= /DNA_START= /DNA_END= /DNA_ORIENTATION=
MSRLISASTMRDSWSVLASSAALTAARARSAVRS